MENNNNLDVYAPKTHLKHLPVCEHGLSINFYSFTFLMGHKSRAPQCEAPFLSFHAPDWTALSGDVSRVSELQQRHTSELYVSPERLEDETTVSVMIFSSLNTQTDQVLFKGFPLKMFPGG